MPNEATIRDHLAQNLHLIEPGLTLVGVEYELVNPHGAGGSIDILARDANRMLVVIEIKRSDQAARAAIHELEKYTALLCSGEGLGPDRVRCVLASTEWRELRVPYSEFKRQAPYTVDGYLLDIDGAFNVLRTQRVHPLPAGERTRFCPHHSVLLYADGPARDAELATVQTALAEMGVENYIVFVIDAQADRHELLVQHFGLYLVLEMFGDVLPPTLQATVHAHLLDGVRDCPREQATLVAIHARVGDATDAVEAAYPNTLAGLNENWDITRVVRGGRLLRATSTVPDEEIIDQASGVTTGEVIKFVRTVNSRHDAAWKEFFNAGTSCLGNNPLWLSGFKWLVKHSGCRGHDMMVSAHFYDPMSLLPHLPLFVSSGDTRWLPSAEALIHDPATRRLWYASGSIVWTHEPTTDDFGTIMSGLFPRPHEYEVAAQFHGLPVVEYVLAKQLGLAYALRVAMYEPKRGRSMLDLSLHTTTSGRVNVHATPSRAPRGRSIQEWIASNPRLVRSMLGWFQQRHAFLPPPRGVGP